MRSTLNNKMYTFINTGLFAVSTRTGTTTVNILRGTFWFRLARKETWRTTIRTIFTPTLFWVMLFFGKVD